MPWHISDDGKGNCVIKDDTGETVKCHDTHEEAVAHMRALYASEEKSVTFVTYGGVVKALPDNKIGGYLVTFGGLDMTGDYFDAKTDFGEYSKLPVLYHHGFDDKLKTRRIGTAEVRQDEVGLWAEAQLSMRDEYEKMVYEMAGAGKLGWSSGAAAHVTAREDDEKGSHITQWYMAEASLTPCPAEPRNSVMTLKAFLGDSTVTQTPEGEPEAERSAESEGGEDKADIKPILQGETKMENTPELQALLAEVSANSAKEAIKLFRESEPAEKTADIKITKDEAEQQFKDPSEFFQAVKFAAVYPSSIDKRLLPLKQQGMGETVPSHGGFLVPDQVSNTILENVYGTGTLLSLFKRDQVQGNSMTYNIVDETSRADGSRYGGIAGYWLGEGATKTPSHPLFRQLELKLRKVCALCIATDELLEDAGALQSWLMRTVPMELRFRVEDAIINGTGVGMPFGILTSPALIGLARTTTDVADAFDIGRMWSRRYAGAQDYVWLYSPSMFPSLLNLVVGTTPVFLPAGGLSGLPYATLLGRPCYETEYQPITNTAGSFMLISPSAYPMIEKAGGIQSASSIHVYFTTDESAFRFVYRIDGAPSWNAALTGNDGVTVSPFITLAATTI